MSGGLFLDEFSGGFVGACYLGCSFLICYYNSVNVFIIDILLWLLNEMSEILFMLLLLVRIIYF